MNKLIQIDIFAEGSQEIKSGCGGSCSKKGGKSCGCSGGCNKSAKGCCNTSSASEEPNKTLGDAFEELKDFIYSSDIKERVQINFYDLNKINVLDYDNIRILMEMDYDQPFTIVDGIVRYYGGISKELVYKDVKDLIE